METAEEGARRVITERMASHPRSAQSHVGPSELGGCERRLGGRLAFGKPEESDPSGLRWRPQVGTAVHALLDEWFKKENGWLSDHKVKEPVAGTLDAYHVPTGTVVDWKVVGITTLKAARRGKVSEKYETQIDLYGAGMVAQGYAVNYVALCFLPSSGTLAEAVWHEREFDPDRAAAAVARKRKIEALLDVAPPSVVLPLLEISDDWCGPGCSTFAQGFCRGFSTESGIITPSALTIS